MRSGSLRARKGASPPSGDAASSGTGRAGTALSRPDRLSLLLVGGLTLLLLLPFLGKAFHIDDPLFLWTARQIRQHPFDPLGFSVNWRGTAMPMSEITKNPPLASYLLAVATSLLGESERVLHGVFLLPALAASLGTYLLARRLCGRPLLATVAALGTPAFLVSATTLMCDTLALAFWVWAVHLWIEGLDRDDPGRLYASGALVAASALAKYFGIALVPLLAAYAVAMRARPRRFVPALSLPLLVLGLYLAWMRALYGKLLLAEAVAYAVSPPGGRGGALALRGLVGLCFTGGCLLSAAALSLASLPWRPALACLAAGSVAGAFAGASTSPGGLFPLETSQAAAIGIHFGAFVSAGLWIAASAALGSRRIRQPDVLLLALWAAGCFVFAALLNWTINARSVLPLAPAAGILAARGWERASAATSRVRRSVLAGLVGTAIVLALAVAWGDLRLADSAKAAAREIRDRARVHLGSVWFEGHWGFQYYMEAWGALPVDLKEGRMAPGDLVVLPDNNTTVYALRADAVDSKDRIVFPVGGLATPLRGDRGAGFYAHVFGPLPFRFGAVPPEGYSLLRLATPGAVSGAVEPRARR